MYPGERVFTIGDVGSDDVLGMGIEVTQLALEQPFCALETMSLHVGAGELDGDLCNGLFHIHVVHDGDHGSSIACLTTE